MRDGKPVSRPKFLSATPTASARRRSGSPSATADHQQPCEPWSFHPAGRGRELLRAGAPELGLNGSFAVFKMIRNRRGRIRELPSIRTGQIDPELLAAKMWGRLAQRTFRFAFPQKSTAPRRDRAGAIEQLRLREYRRVGRPQGTALSGWGAYPPRSIPEASPSLARVSPAAATTSPTHSTRHAVWPGLPSRANRTTASNAGSDYFIDSNIDRTNTSSC